MKDGYSFHSSENDLASFYEKVGNAYENIFKSCGLQTVGVEADSGAIGGASSKEFMVTADAGEDSILFTQSGSYAANIEKAVSLPSKPIPLKDNIADWLETPKQKTIPAHVYSSPVSCSLGSRRAATVHRERCGRRGRGRRRCGARQGGTDPLKM